jgi:hypothetical protein
VFLVAAEHEKVVHSKRRRLLRRAVATGAYDTILAMAGRADQLISVLRAKVTAPLAALNLQKVGWR